MARAYGADMMGKMSAAFSQKPAEALPETPAGPSIHDGRKALQGAATIEVDRIVPDPDQPRKTFDPDKLEELSGSLATRGLLTPIRVRWSQEMGKYVVVVGERRWRAAMMAGLPAIPCVVVSAEQAVDDRLEDQIVENAQREDIGAVEKAKAWSRLAEMRGYTQEQLAARLHVTQQLVSMTLRLLVLPEGAMEAIDNARVPASVAYELTRLDDPAEQARLADEVAAGSLKRSDVRARVAKARSRGAKPGTTRLPLERKHRAANGLSVLVKGRKGFDEQSWLEALEDAVAAVRMARERRESDAAA